MERAVVAGVSCLKVGRAKYFKATGHDAVAASADGLIAAWGDAAHMRTVRWDLALRAGRV